jgi:hypothetical protein
MGRRQDLVRAGAALVATLVIAACTDAPTVGPTASAGPGVSPGASTTPTELASLPPLETPAPTPIPTQAAAAGDWNAVLGQKSVTNAQFLDVIWTGSRFIAAGVNLNGGGVLVSSTDGQRWRSIPAGGETGSPEHLAAGPSGVVAVGTIDARSAAWVSADGRNWTYRTRVFPTALGSGDEVRVTDVVATATGWLAVGRDDPFCPTGCPAEPLRALMWTSTDGETWTRLQQPSFPGGGINSVTAFDGGYVAVGDSSGHAAIWTSPDGLGWTRIGDDPMFGAPADASPDTTVTAVGVAAAFGSIVVVGMANGATAGGGPIVMAWRSTDGHSWSPAPVEAADEGQVFSVAATNSGFLATGPSGETSCLGGIWSSIDGASWACEASDPGFAGFGPYAAAGSPGVDVVVGLTDAGWDPESGIGAPGAIWWRPLT